MSAVARRSERARRRRQQQPVAAAAPALRLPALDALRGLAVLWMTAFHFCFDLNHFGLLQQDFYTAPLWTLQRVGILSLFLYCAGAGQALAQAQGQSARAFARRWLQVAAGALLVSVGSAWMFPNSWIYFGVLHGMALMLLLARFTARWRLWLWPAAAAVLLLYALAAPLHALWPAALESFNGPTLNWLGFISRKPVTEDYVPLLPWLAVLWLGLASVQWAHAHGWLQPGSWLGRLRPPALLIWIGRHSLPWYLLHQLLLMGLLTTVLQLR